MRNFEKDLKQLREEGQTFEELIFNGSKEIIHRLYQFESEATSSLADVASASNSSPSELGQVVNSIEQFAQKGNDLGNTAKLVSLVQIDQLFELSEFFNHAECLNYFSKRSNLTSQLTDLTMICLVSSSDPEHSSFANFALSEAGSLFSKMVDSFKIEKGKIGIILHAPAVHQIDFGKSYEGLAKQEFEMILSTVLNLKPRFLVSFGGLSTNFLRQKKENLSNVHGKFYSIKVTYGPSSHTFEHFPLFHPSLLLANPSNKKIAWEDMKQLINKI